MSENERGKRVKNISAIKEILGQLRYILNSRQKRQAIFVVFTIIIGAAFELLGVTALLPFVQVLLTPDKIMNNAYIQPIIEFFNIRNATHMMILMGSGLAGLYIVKNVFLIFSYYARCAYSAGVQKELSIRMLNSYMSRPYTYFLNVNSAEIMRGCGGDIAGVYAILLNLLTLVAETLTIIAIGCYLFYVDAPIAVGALTLMIIVMVIVVLIFKPAMKKLGIKNMEATALKNKALFQTIQGVKELYVMQRKQLFLADYEKASEDMRKTQKNSEFINLCPDRMIEGVCISGLIGIVIFRLAMGVDAVSYVPKLATFAMAAFKILPSVSKISNRLTSTVYFRPTLINVYDIMVEAEKYEKEKADYLRDESVQEGIIKEFHSVVSLRGIQWQYQGQPRQVLQGISFDIHKGESIALIGPSGAGKTTLSDVILGLLKPQKGSVYMDGIDVYTIPKSWARVVGYVPQAVFLMDDTIRNNIAFGVKNIDEKMIWRAVERAQLKKFIEELPDGLDTMVGERGVRLSGGQKQRIAIARALFNNPQILVLDEATAALDNDTEDAVMEAIDALQGEMTMIIVAHRLTTIKNCDMIYEVRDGKATRRDKEEVLKNVI